MNSIFGESLMADIDLIKELREAAKLGDTAAAAELKWVMSQSEDRRIQERRKATRDKSKERRKQDRLETIAEICKANANER